MIRRIFAGAGLAAVAFAALPAAAQDVVVPAILELSGPGAVSGAASPPMICGTSASAVSLSVALTEPE